MEVKKMCSGGKFALIFCDFIFKNKVVYSVKSKEKKFLNNKTVMCRDNSSNFITNYPQLINFNYNIIMIYHEGAAYREISTSVKTAKKYRVGLVSWSVCNDRENNKLITKRSILKENEGRTSYLFIHELKIFLKNTFFNILNDRIFDIKLYNYNNFDNINGRNKSNPHVSLLLLRSGDIHPNPGPRILYTYNTRGLKSYPKLKRFLNKCYNLITDNPNTIIALQETHLKHSDRARLNVLWRHDYVLSPSYGDGHGGGCLILYNSSFIGEITQKFEHSNGRMAYIVIKDKLTDSHSIVCNIYAPNNHDSSYFEMVYEQINKAIVKHSITSTYILGDWNLCMEKSDSNNRQRTIAEAKAIQIIKHNNDKLDLVDAYRTLHKQGGFTWTRGQTASRLDMIFLPNFETNKIVKSEVIWGLDKSDHGAVKITLNDVKLERGPGIKRLHLDMLRSDNILNKCKDELKDRISEIPEEWCPHLKWSFVKTITRSIIMEHSKKYANADRNHRVGLECEINTLRKVLDQAYTTNDQHLITQTNNSIEKIQADLDVILENESKKLAHRAQSTWYNEGEKSNKYFLNIIKKREASQQINSIIDEHGNEKTNIKDKLQLAEKFYSNIYKKNTKLEKPDLFLSSIDNPTVTDQQNAELDRPISLNEIYNTLKTCKESSPGSDSLTYSVYSLFWEIIGKYLLDAWEYSNKIGELPQDQKISLITLLEKKGKNPKYLNNLRPITLSNCDIKLITKTYANRVAKILPCIIHKSQTAYIKGRQVHDNLRMLEYCKNEAKKRSIDLAIISLDARKAFDSIDHNYMYACLRKYGFSDNFIRTVKLIYTKVKAKVLINGFESNLIDIEQSVKQGDALSCDLFVICIDPLIRRINSDNLLKNPIIGRNYYKLDSTAGYADDIAAMIEAKQEAIQRLFDIYMEFSEVSGLYLNADKTEMVSNVSLDCTINYNNSSHRITTLEHTKICGKTISFDDDIEKLHNVTQNIMKM